MLDSSGLRVCDRELALRQQVDSLLVGIRVGGGGMEEGHREMAVDEDVAFLLGQSSNPTRIKDVCLRDIFSLVNPSNLSSRLLTEFYVSQGHWQDSLDNLGSAYTLFKKAFHIMGDDSNVACSFGPSAVVVRGLTVAVRSYHLVRLPDAAGDEGKSGRGDGQAAAGVGGCEAGAETWGRSRLTRLQGFFTSESGRKIPVLKKEALAKNVRDALNACHLSLTQSQR
eukprot:757876-Hanusia_phi.AAC.3